MAEDDLEIPIGDVKLGEGVWLEDDWFALARINEHVLAIGEPAYHQRNWSYLITGTDASLLFDTGCGRRDIAPLIERHATKPLKVLPSHLHFDHLGGINSFGPVLLADLPMIRDCCEDGVVTPTDDMFLGHWESLPVPTFEVEQWIGIGEKIDLGGLSLDVLHTPGHSPDSISLHWHEGGILFAADFLYGGGLYAQTPGASLPDYLTTAEHLAADLPTRTRFLSAHGQPDENGRSGPPELGREHLLALVTSLKGLKSSLQDKRAEAEGTWPVKGNMHLIYGTEASAQWR